MYKKLALLGLSAALLHGCASVKVESDYDSDQAKRFAEPNPGSANYMSTAQLASVKR